MGSKVVVALSNSVRKLEADEVVMSAGIQPINSFLDSTYLTEGGWVDVNNCFVVKGSDAKLFAIGDDWYVIVARSLSCDPL